VYLINGVKYRIMRERAVYMENDEYGEFLDFLGRMIRSLDVNPEELEQYGFEKHE